MIGVRSRLLRRKHERQSRELAERYEGDALQLGAGGNRLPGWLNTDFYAADPAGGVAIVDVTRPLPFPDGRFRFVFSEHLIEHIAYDDAERLLRECFRVLRPGGILRIATPNLRALLELSDDHWYVTYAFERYENVRLPSAAHVINNFMRDWGHLFVYDVASLRRALETAGFEQVRECAVGESSHPELTGIEAHQTVVGERANAFETFVVEATKPLA